METLIVICCYAAMIWPLRYFPGLLLSASDSKRRHRHLFGGLRDMSSRRNTAALIKMSDNPLFLKRCGRVLLLIGVMLLVSAFITLHNLASNVLSVSPTEVSPLLLLFAFGIPFTLVGGLHTFRQERPAGIIYLAESSENSLKRMEQLGHDAYPIRPVALLSEHGTHYTSDNSLRVRKGKGLHWKEVVMELCRFVGVILLDPGEFREPVRWETQYLVDRGLGYKTIMVGFELVPLSDRTKSLRSRLLADGACAIEDFSEVSRFIRFLVMTVAVFPEERTRHIATLYSVFRQHGDSMEPTLII